MSYGYPYPPADRYELRRDDQVVLASATEDECWRYIHDTHSFSVDWALSHEGYRMVPKAVAP